MGVSTSVMIINDNDNYNDLMVAVDVLLPQVSVLLLQLLQLLRQLRERATVGGAVAREHQQLDFMEAGEQPVVL